MSLTTIFRDALDAIKAAHPELTVAVTIEGKTGTGTKDTLSDASTLTENGETGISSSRVRVNADYFTKPGKGATITVGTNACFVLDVRTDGVGAFYVIEYQVQKPVTFSGDVQ